MEQTDKSQKAGLSALREATATLAALRRTLGEASQGKCVLWVDDQPANNELPRRLLEQGGASVIIALSTDEARAALESRKVAVDLVISDMSRDGNSLAGIELLNYVQHGTRMTPTIVYSDNPLAETHREDIRAVGGIGPLVGPQSLMDAIASVLTAKKPNAEHGERRVTACGRAATRASCSALGGQTGADGEVIEHGVDRALAGLISDSSVDHRSFEPLIWVCR